MELSKYSEVIDRIFTVKQRNYSEDFLLRLAGLVKPVNRSIPLNKFPKFEIGFESRNMLDTQKLLLIGLPIGTSSGHVFLSFIDKLNISQWRRARNELSLFYPFLLGNKHSLSENYISLAFEFKKGLLYKAKIYFPMVKGHDMKVLFGLHPCLKKSFAHYAYLLNIRRFMFAMEYRAGVKHEPVLKIYTEFSKRAPHELDLFLRFLSRITLEYKDFCFEQDTISFLLKQPEVERIGLRFKGAGIRNREARLYLGMREGVGVSNFSKYAFHNNPKEYNRWFAFIKKYARLLQGYCSYFCYGEDGMEVFLR